MSVRSNTIRSFIAVDIDEFRVLDNILQLQRILQRTGAAIKPVERSNLHITLRFLGDIAPSLLAGIQESMHTVKFEPFDIEFKDVGVFPNSRRIKVVWIGIQRGSIELLHIYHQLEANLNKLEMKQNRKNWVPHMTIARIRSGKNKNLLLEEVNKMKNEEFGICHINSIRLKQSVFSIHARVCVLILFL